MWRYRDWVIQAFNRDLPYDQFILHQIMGDLLPASAPGGVNADGIVATGVLTLGPWGGIDKKKMLTDIADDRSTSSAAPSWASRSPAPVVTTTSTTRSRRRITTAWPACSCRATSCRGSPTRPT
jgi:hypothetical protein